MASSSSALTPPRERRDPQPHPATLPDPQGAVVRRPRRPRSRQADDGNSAPSRRGSAVEPDESISTASAALALAGTPGALLAEEVDERPQVGPPRPRRPARGAELAHVGEPALAARQREDRAVVARGRDRAPLDDALQRHPRRLALLFDPSGEAASASRSQGGKRGGQPLATPSGSGPKAASSASHAGRPAARRAGGPGRRGSRRPAARPARRAGQGRRAVGEHREVGPQVGHLLLRPVAAPPAAYG